MKLAEALILRADILRRIEQLRERIRQSAQIQEGEQPPEDPAALLSEGVQMPTQLADLMTRINRTNTQATLPDGTTLTAAIAQRDVLALRQSILQTAIDAAVAKEYRYSRSEIRRVATVNVRALHNELDQLARQRRELDTQIQAVNWTTDLVD